MTKGIGIKAGIILGFFAVVLGLAFGCSSIQGEDTTPQIANGEDVFLTVGDTTITNQQMWDKMKISDGLTYLNQYVEEMLLSSYIDQVTQDEIDEAKEATIYGTNDPEAIAALNEDPTVVEDLMLTYERVLILQGLDPDNPEDVRSYFELNIAKELYTKDYIEAITDEENDMFISNSDVEEYYNSTVRGDVCAIVVRFHTYDEATAVFQEFNIVEGYEGRLGLYVGTTPIEEVLTSNFDDTNTNVMSDDKALEKFIDLYNYQYPNRTHLDNSTNLDNFCATYGDEFVFDYDTFTQSFDTTTAQQTLATYMWDTLQLEDDDETDDIIPLRFSSTPRSIDDYQLMVYKISEENVTAFADLTQTEVDDLYAELLDNAVTTDSVSTAMDKLWAQYNYEIYDPLFKLQDEYNGGPGYDNNGSDTLIAKLGDTEITATTLYDYMIDIIGSYYALELVRQESMLHSDYYTDIYGDDYNYLENTSDKMVEHRDELRTMKSIFSSNGYEQYGFSSSDYTWSEFIVLAFGSASESDVLRDVFVMTSLQPNLVKNLISYDSAVDFIQAKIDDYFSLNAEHLLLYLDNDLNFQPDEYNKFVDGLTGADATEYNALVVSFEALVKSKVNNDNYTLQEIVDEYEAGLVGDPENEWADYKAYGFFVMTEDLSQQESLSNSTTGGFDEDFVVALKRIYDSYVIAKENDSSITRYVDNQLEQSNFGMHFIIATEGTDFNQPSAEFDVTDTTYEAGFANDSMVPNEAQINLYIEVKFAELTSTSVDYTVPSTVRLALSAYYDEVFDAYFTASGYTIAAAELMLDQTPQYAANQTEEIAFLQTVIDVLYEVNFDDTFITPAEAAAVE